jgi:hypothetical protein
MEKSGVLRVAVTNSSEVIVTSHVPVPVQFVPQPENVNPEEGEASRITAVPV